MAVIVGLLGCLALGCGGSHPPVAPSFHLSTTSTPAPAPLPDPLIVSVYPFDNRSGHPELEWLRKALPDTLVARLAGRPSIVVIQRDRLDEVLREQVFQLSGHVAEGSAARIGRLVGATVLVTGSVVAEQDVLRIDGQLLNVEQGRVLAAVSAEGPQRQLRDVMEAFATRMEALFPAGPLQMSASAESAGDVAAAEANSRGERLSREGKLFEALAEFERALADNPTDPTARSNYGRTVQSLSGADLLRVGTDPANDRIVADRMTERLLGGMTFRIEQAAVLQAPSHGPRLRLALRVHLDRAAVRVFVDAARSLGASVVEATDGRVDVTWNDGSSIGHELVQRLSQPRRFYIRLLNQMGQTVATYSEFREWTPKRWIAAMGPTSLRIDGTAHVSTDVTVSGLSADQLASIHAVSLTVVTAARDRAVLRVDMTDALERSAREGGDSGTGAARSRDATQQIVLQDLMETLWVPPIVQQTWSRGHVPRNVWSATVLASIDGDSALVEPAHLVQRSGSADFDEACLSAFDRAIARVLGASSTLSDGVHAAAPVGPSHGARKVRAHCEVHADVPLANVIGSQRAVMPLFTDTLHP